MSSLDQLLNQWHKLPKNVPARMEMGLKSLTLSEPVIGAKLHLNTSSEESTPMKANDKQVGGQHYNSPIQHWDYVVANDLDYFQAQITKYVTRWKKKNGISDLLKAEHFLMKYIELQQKEPEEGEPTSGYVNQDR